MASEILVAVSDRTEVLRFADTVRVGRADTNGVVLTDDIVSGVHLELRKTDDGWDLVDLGSTNGTYIDGERVTRVVLRAETAVTLGNGGPRLRLTIPGLTTRDATRVVAPLDIANRYLSDEAPADMSDRTGLIRQVYQERRAQETSSWVKRTRNLRVAVGVLVVLALGAGGVAVWQAQRARALRTAAGDVFNTMKSLELDIRRLEAKAGPDQSVQEHRARLEKQYDDLLKTLGIYSSRTPADVQLIYRTVHRLGESEATVPKGFVDEVRKYIKLWNAEELNAGVARANAQKLGPQISGILLQHHLPREFFFLTLQESGFNAKAIGPSTRFGVPKGLWQIMPSTAQSYGLRLGPLKGERLFDPSDDRHNIAKSTTAAARYLEDLYTTDAQASGLLVMASYNMGETRVLRMIRTLPESPAERNFWALLAKHRKEIPTETYNYVFRVFSAAVICANPKLFGYDFEPPLASLSDSVAVPVQMPK
ncbi:MAG TPA: transglycosylase SLT domain-containing protein [Gemmatimonadaceae bacterium]|nr:transglycosylase SLT domain-containing protein [Gemmatimonadaceae bacterium]